MRLIKQIFFLIRDIKCINLSIILSKTSLTVYSKIFQKFVRYKPLFLLISCKFRAGLKIALSLTHLLKLTDCA